MILVLKSNFRKKSIKIYLLIFSILFLGIFTLESFRQYYYNYYNNKVREQAYIEIISEEDVSDYFTEKNAKITRGAVLYFKDSLECENYTNCKDYLIHVSPTYAYVFPNDDIKENELIHISYRKTYDGLVNLYLHNINQKIVLTNPQNNEKYSFQIHEYKESDFYDYYVSRKTYDLITSKKNIHYYRLGGLDYNKLHNYGEYLTKLIGDKVIYICEKAFNLPPNQMIEDFEVALFFLTILFVIVAIIIFHNIKNDLKRQNCFLHSLGYSKARIRTYNFWILFLLNIMAMIISYVLLFLVLKIVNMNLNIEVQVLNSYSLFWILGINILFILLTFQKKINCHKI